MYYPTDKRVPKAYRNLKFLATIMKYIISDKRVKVNKQNHEICDFFFKYMSDKANSIGACHTLTAIERALGPVSQ